MSDVRCVRCGTPENITRDHRVPKWLYTRIHHLGPVSVPIGKGFKKRNIQPMCAPCNREKSGEIDWEDPFVSDFMRRVSSAITENIKENKKVIHQPECAKNTQACVVVHPAGQVCNFAEHILCTCTPVPPPEKKVSFNEVKELLLKKIESMRKPTCRHCGASMNSSAVGFNEALNELRDWTSRYEDTGTV